MAELNHEQIMIQFLKENNILIADTSAVAAGRLASTLAEFGARRSQITIEDSFESAQKSIRNYKPKMILCDYMLGNKSGLDLLQDQRREFQDSKSSIFVLITANASQSTVARAAEEDIDSFIIKPYTNNTLKSSMMNIIVNKLYPTEYIQLIEKGKDFLFKGEPEEAKKHFESALALDPKPSLACFYLGQADQMINALDSAEGKYKIGLAFRQIHYKCLVGLFEILMKVNKPVEAYEVVRKIAQYFPANPRRLTSVLRLAIITGHYEHMKEYYHLFTQIDVRTEELVEYMCSALIVAGKHYISKKEDYKAFEHFDLCAISSAGKTKYLRFMIESLIENTKPEVAQKYLSRFPAVTMADPDYLISEYLVTSFLVPDLGQNILKGRELIKNKIKHWMIHQRLTELSLQAGHKDNAENLCLEGKNLFPEKKEVFEKLLSMNK